MIRGPSGALRVDYVGIAPCGCRTRLCVSATPGGCFGENLISFSQKGKGANAKMDSSKRSAVRDEMSD